MNKKLLIIILLLTLPLFGKLGCGLCIGSGYGVLLAQTEDTRDVDFHVVMKNKNNGKKEFEAVQYCLVKSLRKAHEVRVSLQKAISKQEEDMTAAPGFYITKAAEREKVSLNVSANNGTFRVNAVDGMAVVVIAQSQYVEVREILPGQQRYFIDIETRVLDEVVKIDRRRRGPDFSNVRGYDTGHELRFSCPVYLPAGIANENCRLFIQPIVIDCETEDTVAYGNPAVFEGLRYHTLQVRRKGFDYYRNDPVGQYYNSSILLDEREDFEFTHEAVVKKPDKNRVYRGCYRVMVEDYTHIVYDSGPVGNSRCLNIHPFKFMSFGNVVAEIPISEEFQAHTQSRFATPGDAVAEYFLNKDAYLSGEKQLSDGDFYSLFSTILNKDELDDLTDLAYKQITSQSGYELNNFSAYVANRKAVMQIRKGLPNLDILRPFIDYNIKRVDMKRQTNWFSSVTINRKEHLVNQAIMMFQTLRLDTAAYILDWLPKDAVSQKVSQYVDSISENWDSIYAELYKTLPETIEEEHYDPAGFTHKNVAKGFNSLDYKLDRRYKPSGDKRKRGALENAWIEGGFGVEKPTSGYNDSEPLMSAVFGLGNRLGGDHAWRARLSAGFPTSEVTKVDYRLGATIEHLYDFSSMLFGYQSDRPFTVSSVLGLGAAYSKYKKSADEGKDFSGMGYEGHLGLQAKFSTSPHGSIAIEPYVGLASNKAADNWKKSNFFYGASLSYVYYFENQLTREKRRRAIKERDWLDEVAADSTLYSWRKPFFFEVAGSANKSDTWAVSLGQWLSTALAVRATVATTSSHPKGRIEGVFNPFGLRKYYLWDAPYGAYILGGMFGGKDMLGYSLGAHGFVRLSDAVQAFVEPRFERSFKENAASRNELNLMLGVTVTSKARSRIDWTRAEEKDYIDMMSRLTVGVGGGCGFKLVKNARMDGVGEVFLEYRLSGYNSIRGDYQYLRNPDRSALSLDWMLNVSSLLAHVNPEGRRTELFAFVGPAVLMSKGERPQYTCQAGAKLQYNITDNVALHLTPAYYLKDKDMTLNIGLQYSI